MINDRDSMYTITVECHIVRTFLLTTDSSRLYTNFKFILPLYIPDLINQRGETKQIFGFGLFEYDWRFYWFSIISDKIGFFLFKHHMSIIERDLISLCYYFHLTVSRFRRRWKIERRVWFKVCNYIEGFLL